MHLLAFVYPHSNEKCHYHYLHLYEAFDFSSHLTKYVINMSKLSLCSLQNLLRRRRRQKAASAHEPTPDVYFHNWKPLTVSECCASANAAVDTYRTVVKLNKKETQITKALITMMNQHRLYSTTWELNHPQQPVLTALFEHRERNQLALTTLANQIGGSMRAAQSRMKLFQT